MKPVFQPADLAAWCGGRWTCPPTAPIRGATNSTNRVEPGDLFVALKGETADGHAFVTSAFQKGAAAALVRRDWDAPSGLPCLAVDDPLAALQAVARVHRLAGDWTIIGVTGSAGKSTVKEMTAALLQRRWPTARTLGNYNNAIGLPLSLLTLAPGFHRFGVFETGSNHPGEIAALAEVLRPEWGIVTNVGPVHVEHFKSLEGVAREKRVLLEALPRDGVAVLNRDTPCFDLLAGAAPRRLRTASLGAFEADLVAESVTGAGDGQRVRIREKDAVHEVRLSLPGRHHALNAMLAALVAREWGLSWAEIDTALAGFEPLAMRWQVVEANGIRVINDAYNANPLNMAAALQTFREMACPGRKWLVLGEMRELGERGAALHAEVGRTVAEGGVWAGLVAVGGLTAPLVEAARAAGFPADRIVCVPDAAAAVPALRERLKKGDAVLLKASRGVGLERVAQGLGAGEKTGGH